MKVVYPIQSIAYHRISRTIYVSSAGYGKIYKLDKDTKTLELVHNPISVSSTAICFNSTDSQLYFSKSNGRDVTISSMDMETGSIEDAYVLYSTFAINDLVIKE